VEGEASEEVEGDVGNLFTAKVGPTSAHHVTVCLPVTDKYV